MNRHVNELARCRVRDPFIRCAFQFFLFFFEASGLYKVYKISATIIEKYNKRVLTFDKFNVISYFYKYGERGRRRM